MTRTLALAAAALLGSLSLAAAQPAPPPASPGAVPEAPAPDQMRDRMREHMRGEGHGPMMEGMMGRRMGRMRGPQGAHFVFEREGAMIDLRCAENETTRACVDAAAVLLDKLGPQAAPAR